MPDPAILAQVWRGDVLEVIIRGHVAVVEAGGAVLASAGDPASVTSMRSAVKPIQVQPFVRCAMDRLGCGVDELAIACASHRGEPRHIATVRALLARAGVAESALLCGPQEPHDRDSARALVRSGAPFQPVHHMCSGKHAAMLATCAVAGWPLGGYTDRAHPLQQSIRDGFRDVAGLDLDGAPVGVDGCGVPTYGVSVAQLAGGFATASRHPGFRRCQDAMAAEPELVRGSGSFDSALLTAAGGDITGKSGAVGTWAGVVRPDGPGVAIKLEAGVSEYLAPVALQVLQALGALPREMPESLARHRERALRNAAGDEVGAVRATVALRGPGI